VGLTWTGSSGATSYSVFRSTTAGVYGSAVASGVSGTSYNDTGLSNGTTYYFVVQATNSAGTSGNSNEASATPVCAKPAAPAGLAANAGDTQVALTWNAVSGATSYSLKRSSVSGGPYTTINSGAGTSFTDTGLTNGATYYYVVSATNGCGEGSDSGQVLGTPVAPTVPAAPTNLSAKQGPGAKKITLTWSAASGATSYTVKRATTSGGPYNTTVATGVTSTSYQDIGLTSGTTYYYVVSAVNNAGASSNSSQAFATAK
jgi:cellulose 1,4-beta-cellobiosidase